MKEQLVSFETAKLAKEKGFNEPCSHYYVLNFRSFKADGVLHKVGLPDEYDNSNVYQFVKRGSGQPHLAGASTQSLLQKWLRETHEIHIQIDRVFNCYQFNVLRYDSHEDRNSFVFEGIGVWDLNTYEEALEEGLKESLKVIQ